MLVSRGKHVELSKVRAGFVRPFRHVHQHTALCAKFDDALRSSTRRSRVDSLASLHYDRFAAPSLSP
jgi:hypothetical protein